MGAAVTGARLGVLEGLSERVDRTGEDLRAGAGPLDSGSTQAASGAGQFAGTLRGGVEDFVVSWVDVLEVCGTAGDLISSGVGDFVEGLRGVDRRASRAVIAL